LGRRARKKPRQVYSRWSDIHLLRRSRCRVALALIFVYLKPPFRYLGIYRLDLDDHLGLDDRISGFATRTTNGGLMQIHSELEEAGAASGARQINNLRKITVPLLIPRW